LYSGEGDTEGLAVVVGDMVGEGEEVAIKQIPLLLPIPQFSSCEGRLPASDNLYSGEGDGEGTGLGLGLGDTVVTAQHMTINGVASWILNCYVQAVASVL
jgi:hypothetical protein